MIPTVPSRPALLIALACSLIVAGSARAANHAVAVTGSAFSPKNLTIQAGDTVTWSNFDIGLAHNVRADNNSFRCANGCDDQGGNGNPATNGWSFTRTFSTPTGPGAPIRYHCQIHGGVDGLGMSGTITVQTGGGSPGTIQFSNATYSITEAAANAVITVRRVGGDEGAASVHYATSNGSATAGSDYTTTTGTLNWPAGNDNNMSFAVPILNDTTPENNETVNLTLSNATGAALGSPSSATLTIVDNDSAPGPAGTLSLTTAAQSVGEGSGPATVTVQRAGGSNGSVSVSYQTGDGSATGGDDYTPASGSLTFGNGDTANKSFNVGLLDDGEIEGDETINVTLSNPTGGAALGSPSSQTVTILDDDFPMGPCVADDFTLCLHGDRFEVTVDFRAPSDPAPRPAHAIPFTERAGMFWFFNEANIEMLLKVQNACIDPFNHYWVFFAATTNVELRVTVIDTVGHAVKVYTNDQGVAALPIQDTGAFATCP